MTKAILLSVRPYWAYLIWKLIKTLELRKKAPKWLNLYAYIYVTKRTQDLKKIPEEHREMVSSWMGNVPMRFWYDEYDKTPFDIKYQPFEDRKHNGYCYYERELDELCLTLKQIEDYGKGKDLYAWNIKKLEIFKTPKELSEFYKTIEGLNEDGGFDLSQLKKGEKVSVPQLKKRYLVERAPQSYQFVYIKEEENE